MSNTRIDILNGPNLNLLGSREPEHYGAATLASIESTCREVASDMKIALEFRQSNHEGVLIDWIQGAKDVAHGIIINAGGFTHTSVAIGDALRAVSLPVVELHVSNIYRRESYRHQSYIAPAALGIIAGFGAHGYVLAMIALHAYLGEQAALSGPAAPSLISKTSFAS